jgi:tetratricopeptide (TPR) repeat protein
LPPRESFPLAKEAAERALSLDTTLAEAHTSLAFVKEAFEWDFAGARIEYRRAIDLDPDYAPARQRFGMFLSMMGRFDEGLAELELARRLDPTSLIINSDVGLVNYFARRYDRCIEHLRNTVELHPSSFRPHINLVGCYVQKGMFDDAIAESEKALSLMVRGGPGARSILGYSYAAAGRERDARAILEEWSARPRRFAQPFSPAAAYAALGDKGKALELLEAGYEQRAYMPRLGVDPALDSLRSDRRFQDLVRRVGLLQ